MAAPLTTPKASVAGLTVQRGGRTILHVSAFAIRRGEVLALIGPNGAGKSTLLQHLALLQRPPAGAEIRFDDAPVRGRELSVRRRMAVVFQEPLLLDRTAHANVEAGLRMRGVRAHERHARAGRWLAAFGVGHLSGRSARTLSGGEAQRVSLARAFALEPELLLLDEPFSALDQPTRESLTGDLAHALSESATTALVVTHDRDEAARLGDRVAVMIDGRIRQIGTPAEVFGAPADAAVASFVGVETIFPARVVESANGLLTLEAGAHRIEAIAEGSFSDALVCLRPEDISLSIEPEQAMSTRNHLPGRVRRIVESGAEARVELDCGVPVVCRVTRRSVEELRLTEGMDVIASFKATAVHLIPR